MNLGEALLGEGRVAEALVELEEAVRLMPSRPQAHYNLGIAFERLGRFEDAVAAYEAALVADPAYAEAACNLGLALRNLGRYAESLRRLERGHELGTQRTSWPYDSAAWVAEARRLAAREPRLESILAGDETPRDAAEADEAVVLGLRRRDDARAFAVAQAALQADAASEALRYDGACAAVRRSRAEGVPEDERRALRAQARTWLEAALRDRPDRRALAYWLEDPDLEAIRDRKALEALDETERAAFDALWKRVRTAAAAR
jgi:tetratricopeptide (TPR) repeat protein